MLGSLFFIYRIKFQSDTPAYTAYNSLWNYIEFRTERHAVDEIPPGISDWPSRPYKFILFLRSYQETL
jgi:hypothetical protein